jgi:hypothetical protein
MKHLQADSGIQTLCKPNLAKLQNGFLHLRRLVTMMHAFLVRRDRFGRSASRSQTK